MNKYLKNRLFRIATIVSLLNRSDENEDAIDSIKGATINEISKLLSLDKTIVRRDVVNLIKNKHSMVEYWDDDIDSSGLINSIFNGEYDDERFVSYTIEQKSNYGFIFPETMVLLKNDVMLFRDFINNYITDYDEDDYLSDFLMEKSDKDFYTKKLLSDSDEKRMIKNLLKRIYFGQKIQFDYVTKDNKVKKVVMLPERIEFNADIGFSYLISNKGIYYRIDKIGKYSVKKSDQIINEPHYKREEPFHIKIKIKKQKDYDVYMRVVADLKGRNRGKNYSPEEHITDMGDYYIYEDDVSDEGYIKSWIYGYGSKMLVFEPISLRKKIIESYEERLKLF